MGSWAIMALNAALFGGCCFLVANVVTEIAGEVIEPDSVIADSGLRRERVDAPQAAAHSVILERNLFGAQLSGDAQVAVETEEPLAKTKLPLRLLGTAAATEVTRSRAAIENESTRKHMIVAIGDRIEGHNRVRVERIERTRVILDNAGRPEELLLFENKPFIPARPPVAAPERQARRRGSRANNVAQDRLRKLSGSEGDGISKLLSQARISPSFDDTGDVLGMQIDAIKQGSLFESAGLENGDVIMEVNGIVIDRQEATPAVLEELLNAESIQIAAERDGVSIQLSADADALMEQR